MPEISRRARSLGTENAFVVLAEVNELARQGKDIISFCIGQPDFHTPVNIQDAAVKAIREGSVNLRDSFARLENGEVWLMNVHISPYSHTGYAHHEERRQRKLLLHRHEIQKLTGRVVEKGLTLVPLQMYMKKGRVKVVLALVKGKQAHDKRETLKKRSWERERGRLLRQKG